MNKYDLLEAMNGIREDFIEEAADKRDFGQAIVPAASVQDEPDKINTETSENGQSPEGSKKKKTGFTKKILKFQRWAATAAALLFVSILLPNMSPDAASAFQGIPLFGNYFRAVTFRTWQYQDGTSDAYVEEPGIITKEAEKSSPESAGAADPGDDAALASGYEDGETVPASGGLAMQEFDTGEAGDDYSADLEEEEDTDGTVAEEAAVSVRAATSAAQINEAVRNMAADEIERFEKSVEVEIGYRSLRFLHEVVTDSDSWFCLKVLAYTSAADGYEEVTHFNIDKRTGAWVSLPDLFPDGTDYVTPISENIKDQMRAHMEADPDAEYWLESVEEPDEVFEAISPDQDYYVNDKGELVICFNEMEAAPLYMGTLEFVIPAEITSSAGMK